MNNSKTFRKDRMSLIFMLILFSQLTIFSQSKLSGNLVDYTNQKLEFANVLLLNSIDSTLYKGTITDEMGHFEIINIEPGNYLLEASMIGLESHRTALSIVENQDHLNLGVFTLKENATLLDGVTVTARKVLFEKKADRTIINVQANAINKGNTILNVLRSSPGLMVGRDEILMAGKQGVRIMLNGKILRMPLDGIMQMLEGMSASNVESIELITNPGAQYEAEGNAGFINIVLRDSPDLGWTANVGATTGMNQGINAGTNLSMQYRGRKIATTANYSINYNKNEHIWNVYQSSIDNEFLSFIDGKTQRDSRILNQNLNLGMTYAITANTELSLSLSGIQSLHRQRDINNSRIVHSVDSTSTMLINIIEPNHSLTGSSSIGLQHKISKNSNIKIFYDYLRYQNRQEADYALQLKSNNVSPAITSKLNTTKRTPLRFNVISVDYDADLNPKLSLSTGGRMAVSSFVNEVAVNLSGFPIYDVSAIQPKSLLSENIYAAYTQFTYNVNNRLHLEGGIRYEHTSTDIKDENLESVVLRKYGNWFPSANLSYKIKENTSIQVVYNRRITRPTFNDLAPFVFFQNPSTLVQGNSQLLPAIMHGLDITYTQGKHWITFQYGRTKDFISFFTPEVVEGNSVTYSTQNLDFMQMFGVNLNPNIQFYKWWTSSNSLSFQTFTIGDERLGEKFNKVVNNILVNSNHSFQIREGISANVGLNYNHSGFVGLVDYAPQWMANAGISKRLKNGSQLSLRFTDIFASYVWEGGVEFGNGTQSFYFDQNLRAIDLSWSMPFGNKKLKSVKVDNGSANERARVN